MLTSRVRRGDDWFDRSVQDTIRDFFRDEVLPEFSTLNMIPSAVSTTGAGDGGNVTRSEVFVPIDFIEKPKEYIIHAELPGVAKENIAVNIEPPNNLLVISGNKEKCCGLETNDFYRRNERSTGRLHRRIRLPLNANYDKADVQYCDGMLCITIPKKEPEEQGVYQLQIK